MNVSLTREQEALIRRLIESGRCGSESEAVDEALKLLEEDERGLAAVRRKLQESIGQADRGEAEPFDRALTEKIKAEGREMLASERTDV